MDPPPLLAPKPRQRDEKQDHPEKQPASPGLDPALLSAYPVPTPRPISAPKPRPRSLLAVVDGQPSSRSPQRTSRRPTSVLETSNPEVLAMRDFVEDNATLPPLPSPHKFLRSPSPVRGRSPSPVRSHTPLNGAYNPFNFEPQVVTSSPARPSQRKGHRYKHSSVSINFFQEPEARAPLAIPLSLAIPTFAECWQSITPRQYARLAYVVLRVIAVWSLFAGSYAAHSTAALAHLVAYDVVVNTVTAGVDILGNFEVWAQSSLRLPFALQRVEVLVGFALSITLMFFGFDIFSHVIQDIAQTLASDGHEHAHHHGRPDTGEPAGRVAFLMAVANTAFVVTGLIPYKTPVAAWTQNQIGCVTALFCCIVIAVPLMGPLSPYLDTVLTPVMALAMVYFGWQVSKYFGGMLVMSHVGPDKSAEIIAALENIPNVASVSEVSVWQVHHDLWLASAKIVMSGTDEDERRTRETAEVEMRRILGEDIPRLETTIDISRTTLD